MLKPTLNRVIILPDEVPTTTDSGIILQPDLKDPPREGTVIATGPDANQVSEGNRVVFPPFGGQSLKFEGVTYLVVPEDDILGVLED